MDTLSPSIQSLPEGLQTTLTQITYSVLDAGGSYFIDTEKARKTAQSIGINFDDSYVERVIRKYYGKSFKNKEKSVQIEGKEW